MRALSKDPQSRRQPQVQPPCSDGAAAAAGTRQHVAAAATTDIDSSILRRLEVLERQVGALLAASAQRRHCNAGARGSDDHNGSGSESSSTGSSSSSKPRGEQHARGEQQQAQASGVVGRVAGAMEEAASDAVERLHPAFVQFLNSGYMESQRQLRDRLLSSEWDGTVRTWALRKGVADFERWVAEHGGEAGVELRWDVVQVRWRGGEHVRGVCSCQRCCQPCTALQCCNAADQRPLLLTAALLLAAPVRAA